jgi:hypothetical protein
MFAVWQVARHMNGLVASDKQTRTHQKKNREERERNYVDFVTDEERVVVDVG